LCEWSGGISTEHELRSSELIGKQPDSGEWFELEASVEEVFRSAMLSPLGRACTI